MENGGLNSPPCPSTATVRRNPPRRARPTPSTNPVASRTVPSSKLPEISSFPIQDILSEEISQSDATTVSDSLPSAVSSTGSDSENLKVFLRVRPLVPRGSTKVAADRTKSRNVWPQNPKKNNTVKEKNQKKKGEECCIKVGDDSCSVTVSPPEALQDSKRSKTEIYEGFSHVFSADSTQTEVYERMVNPLVEDFLKGKSRMLAALGPTGSGKTHTMFGSTREPGVVPQALKRIFQQTKGRCSDFSRLFYLSIFEICGDRGKSEKISDLSPDETDMQTQQSSIRGVQEVLVQDAAQAESLIARAMLKRFTAATNSNSQSSRSQCIININSKAEKGKDVTLNDAVLTFVDLAGAEREKRTGNQGARLVESNFINNTSLVFGLCLRALLEHQKNPKKPLQKHFQNSMLTRYLRDYLEGKKHMALILTLKPGEADYLDASYMLRQASPFMKIKFAKVEEESSLQTNKRHFQTLPRLEQPKRLKVTKSDACKNEEKDISNENQLPKEDAHQIRNHQIMQNFAKALWNVLKEYKEKLKVAENEILTLREDLSYKKEKFLDVKKELDDLKSRSTFSMEKSTGSTIVTKDANCVSSIHLEQHTSCNANETNSEVQSPDSTVVECTSTSRGYELNSGKDQVLSQVVEFASNCTPEKCDSLLKQQEDPCSQTQEHVDSGTEVHREAISSKLGALKDRSVKEEPQATDVHLTNPDPTVANTSSTDVENLKCLDNQNELDMAVVERANEDLSVKEEPQATDAHPTVANTSIIDVENFNCLDNQNELDVAVVEPAKEKHESVPGNRNSKEVFWKEPDCVLFTDDISSIEASETGVSSSGDDSSSPIDPLQQISENDKVTKHSPALPKDNNIVPETETQPDSTSKPPNIEKPKRRLLPAKSVLLRNISTLDVNEDIDILQKPKGNKGGKKPAVEEKQRTKGNISLVRLLQRDLHI